MMKPDWFQNRRPPTQTNVGRQFPQTQARAKGKRSFAARWGSPLLFEGGFLGVPTTFFEFYSQIGLSTGEAMFFLHLMSFKWTEDAPFPSYKTLSERMGISDEMARLHAKNLEDKGLLVRVFRKGRSNAFDLTPFSAVLLSKVLKDRREKASKKAAA